MQTEPEKRVPKPKRKKSLDNAQTQEHLLPHASARVKHSLGPWSVRRDRNYSLLFWGQLISSAGTQMQVVAVAWQVFLITNSPLAL